MADYAFVTVWRLAAPLDDVWDAVYHSERWPRWWRGVERVLELQRGDEQGVGSVRRYTWKSRLPYRLTFDMRLTRVEPHVLIEGLASGELAGLGRWQFSSDGSIATVRYDWNVHTTSAWMNALAPVARPLFAWNHDVLMRQGAEGLARLLDARLAGAADR